MRYKGVKNGCCPQVWTAVHSHALKAVHRIMPVEVGGWVVDRPLRCVHNRKNGCNI